MIFTDELESHALVQTCGTAMSSFTLSIGWELLTSLLWTVVPDPTKPVLCFTLRKSGCVTEVTSRTLPALILPGGFSLGGGIDLAWGFSLGGGIDLAWGFSLGGDKLWRC